MTASLRDAAQQALAALTDSVDSVRNEYTEARDMYRNYPTRQGKVSLLKTAVDKHEAAIAALRAVIALPDEPVTRCGGMRAGCNYLAPCGSLCRKCGYVHATPQPAPVQQKPLTDAPEPITGACGQCKDTRQPCSCTINAMLKDRELVAVNREHYLAISDLAKAERERKPLTDRQTYDCIASTVEQPESFEVATSDASAWAEVMEFIRAIEAAHGIKGAA